MEQDRIVLSTGEKNEIIDWINNNKSKFIVNYNNFQKYIDIHTIDDELITKILNDVKDRLIVKEKLQKYQDSNHLLKDFIYISEPGTKLHYHIDIPDNINFKDLDKNKTMVRFNICIKKPERGGRPIYSGKIIDLIELEYVICRSGIEFHTSEWIVKGDKINLSLGFLIDNDDLHLYTDRENVLVDNIYINTWENEEIKIESSDNKFILENDIILKNTIQYHINNNIKDFNNTQYYIEYSFIDENFDFIYENINKTTPELCLLFFLSDTSNPIIFTNIDNDSYKYKEVSENDNIIVFIPKKNTHIVMNHSNYYRFINMYDKIDKPKYIKIRVWNKTINSNNLSDTELEKAYNINIYDLNDSSPFFIPTYYNNIIVSEYLNYRNFVDRLLYDSSSTEAIIQEIDDFVSKNSEINIFCICGFEKATTIDYDKLLGMYGDLTDDIYPFIDKRICTIKNTNRFYKNTIFLNTLSQNVCFWIINEAMKSSEWKKNVYNNYKTYLNLENIPSVLSFVLFLSNSILYQIQNKYNFMNGPDINIKDIFICKYTSEDVYDDSYTDDSFISVNINLNDINTYSGGEVIFDDSNDNVKLKGGDMIVYNGKKKRMNCKINSGEKYILVILTEILLSNT